MVRFDAVLYSGLFATFGAGCAGPSSGEPSSGDEAAETSRPAPAKADEPSAPGAVPPAEPAAPNDVAANAAEPLPTPNGEPGTDPGLTTSGEPASEPSAKSTVTWHADIAPLVIGKCSGCHHDGGISPFSLETYEQASTLAPVLKAAIDDRTMPPWGAEQTDECQPRFGFKDDLSLSAEEIALFDEWADTGAAEGDPADAAPLPTPPSLELDEPDLSLPLPDVTVEGTDDRFLCFSMDPGFASDTWVTATQVVPGNSAIVHHVLTYVDPTGESAALANEDGYYDCFGGPGVSDPVLLGAWAPGGVPFRAPEGVAMTVPAGGRVVVNVHYHPTGAGTEVDSGTHVDFDFAKEEPLYDGQIILIGNFSGPGTFGELLPGDEDPASGPSFIIPAGSTSHVETMRLAIPPVGVPEGIIWGVGTHMHYVGTDMRMTIQHQNTDEQPAEECLLETPHWDFNWQRGYLYDAPLDELPTAGPGDVLEFRCTYDNSLDNPFVREALDEQGLTEPRDVRLGETSLDEMCLGAFAVAYPR
jgi:hypothetical protein